MTLAPTLSFLVVYLSYWLVCRTYGWRATLSPGTFLMFFTFGTVGSVLFALYLEAIPLPFPTEEGTRFEQVDPVTWLTGPSIEEVAKILPLLGIVAFFPAARRLSLADFALMGFATGLGFGFVEGNLSFVLSTDLATWGNIFAFGYGTGTPQAQYLTYSTGHEVQPALVGLALGIGVRLWPDRYWKWLPGAAMLVYVAFDHSMWNFKQQHQYANSFNMAPPFLEAAYRLALHGFLAVVLLPVGLVVASFLEGRWSWRAVKSPDALLLPDEHAGLLSEARLLWDRRKLGSGAILRTLTYLRHRRAAVLAAADAARAGSAVETSRFAELSRERLMREREIVAILAPSPWLPSRRTCLAIARTLIRRYLAVLIVSLLMLLIFAVAPKYLPWMHEGRVALAIVLASAAYTVWRIVKFVRARKPSPQTSDGEALVDYRARAMMLGASAVASGIPVVALGLNRQSLLLGALAYIPRYAEQWTQGGGAMRVLMAGGGAATAAQPTTRKPPCEDLRREADAGAERVKALETNLERLIGGLSPRGARPVSETVPPGGDLAGKNLPIFDATSGPGGASPSGWTAPNIGGGAPAGETPSERIQQFLRMGPSPDGTTIAPLSPLPAGIEHAAIPAKSRLDGLIDKSSLIPIDDPRSVAIPNVASGAPAAANMGSAMPLSVPGMVSGSPASVSPGNPADWLKAFQGARGLKARSPGWTDAPPMPEPMKLPPGTPGIEDIQRAEAQLDTERAAQEKRIAALNACLSQAATRDKPVADTPDGLQKAFDDAKRAYDQAQADLNKAMNGAVKTLADFNTAYNDIWNKAIGNLDQYMVDHRPLAAPLAQMWKDLAMNERIKQFAEGVDMLSGAAQLGSGLLKQSLAAEAKAMAPELERAGGTVVEEAANLEKQAATLERQAADAENAAKQELSAAEKPNAPPQREPLKVEEYDPNAPEPGEAPAATTEADAAAKQAAEQSAARLEEMKNAPLLTDNAARKAVMQDEVRKAIESGAADNKKLFMLRDDVDGANTIGKGMENFPKSDGWTVTVHGQKTGDFSIYSRVDGTMMRVDVTPAEMAQMMRDSGYVNGQPVLLASCWAGNGPQPAAQQLAVELGAQVRAPRGVLALGEAGQIEVRKLAAGEARYVTYGPDGSVVR